MCVRRRGGKKRGHFVSMNVITPLNGVVKNASAGYFTKTLFCPSAEKPDDSLRWSHFSHILIAV